MLAGMDSNRMTARRVRVMARFGRAELVVNDRGRVEIRGGTREERLEAREWISLFLHEAVPEMAAER